MRIVLEPTGVNPTPIGAVYHKVVIEHPSDDLDIDETIRLISKAVVAFGFHENTVAQYFKEVANG